MMETRSMNYPVFIIFSRKRQKETAIARGCLLEMKEIEREEPPLASFPPQREKGKNKYTLNESFMVINTVFIIMSQKIVLIIMKEKLRYVKISSSYLESFLIESLIRTRVLISQ